MFLGSVIHQERVAKKLTQTQLAYGICTQNTISKIENHNLAPTVNILLKICVRLELTLNDVFSDFTTSPQTEEQTALNNLEQQVMLGHGEQVTEQLQLINTEALSINLLMQFYFVQGTAEFAQQAYDAALFTFDRVLQLSKSDEYNIYTLLSYVFKGRIYEQQQAAERAAYYFDLLAQAIAANFEIENANGLEKLFIDLQLAEHFDHIGDSKKVLQYCQQAFTVNQQNQTVPYIADFYLLLAKNATADEQAKATVNYRDAAKFFAALTDNQNVLANLEKLS